MDDTIWLFIALFIKHFLADSPLQTPLGGQGKGPLRQGGWHSPRTGRLTLNLCKCISLNESRYHELFKVRHNS